MNRRNQLWSDRPSHRTARRTLLTLAASLLFLPVPTASAGQTLRVLSLGDSYSAGVGLGPVTAGCDRNTGAHTPRAVRAVLQKSRTVGLKHLACSGATAVDVRNSQLPQVNRLFNTVTLTAGGNDIGFAAKVKGCILGDCGPDVYGLQADIRGGSLTWDQLHARLRDLYVDIRGRMDPSGHMYVLSYPIPFARPVGATGSCHGATQSEQKALNALVTRLGDTIYWAAQSANATLAQRGLPGNVHFVDWRTYLRTRWYVIPTGYPGAGQRHESARSTRGLCNTAGQTPYTHGIVGPPDVINSFHPNSRGYDVAAARLINAINAAQP